MYHQKSKKDSRKQGKSSRSKGAAKEKQQVSPTLADAPLNASIPRHEIPAIIIPSPSAEVIRMPEGEYMAHYQLQNRGGLGGSVRAVILFSFFF